MLCGFRTATQLLVFGEDDVEVITSSNVYYEGTRAYRLGWNGSIHDRDVGTPGSHTEYNFDVPRSRRATVEVHKEETQWSLSVARFPPT